MLDKVKYPTVTAVLNTHNSERVVELAPRALRSIAAQVFNQPWEVIVINDGEPSEALIDALQPVADELVARGVPCRMQGTDEVSEYQCRPKNVAVWLARGEYLSYLDYDNEWTPDHLQVLYNAITEGKVWPDFTYGRRRYVVDDTCPGEMTLPDGSKFSASTGESPLMEWTAQNVMLLGSNRLYNFVDSSDFMCSKGA